MLRTYARVAIATSLALSVTGCPALTSALGNSNTSGTGSTGSNLTTAVTTAIDSVLAAFGDSADLSGDVAGAASFLASAQDNGSGAGLSVQSLRSVQDVSGNLGAGFTFPSPQSSASFTPAAPVNSAPYWLSLIFDAQTGLARTIYVSRNHRWTTTATYYVNQGAATNKPPFGSEVVVADGMDGTVHSDEIIAPEATASTLTLATPTAAPPIFTNASPGLEPTSDMVRSTTITFPRYGYTDGDLNTAVGSRWVVYNTASAPMPGKYYPIYSWIRALEISRTDASGSLTVDHYDIATNYQPELNAAGKSIKAPFEFITDDYNPAKKTEWHNDRTYSPSTYTWTGNGYFVTAQGSTHSVQTTWNTAATTGASDVWTRTASWSNKAGQKIAFALDYNYDESGTGSIAVNGTPFAALKWGTNFLATVTLSNGQTLKYRVPRP